MMLEVGLKARQDVTLSSAVIMDLSLVMVARHRCALPAVISAQDPRLSDAFRLATFQPAALLMEVQIVCRKINRKINRVLSRFSQKHVEYITNK